MRNTKRFFISLFIAIFTMSMLAGCGGNTAATSGTTAATESKDKEPVVIDSNGEGAVQGGIKSDEEIAALQEEEAAFAAESEASESDQPAEFEDNSGHEPEAYGSGNFQDYWEGEDYFDLVQYLKDNGADKVFGIDGQSYSSVEGAEIHDYMAPFYNEQWYVRVTHDAVFLMKLVEIDGALRQDPCYMSFIPNDEGYDVVVNDSGLTVRSNILGYLDTAIQYLKVNHDSDDPLNGSGLNYDKTSF